MNIPEDIRRLSIIQEDFGGLQMIFNSSKVFGRFQMIMENYQWLKWFWMVPDKSQKFSMVPKFYKLFIYCVNFAGFDF